MILALFAKTKPDSGEVYDVLWTTEVGSLGFVGTSHYLDNVRSRQTLGWGKYYKSFAILNKMLLDAEKS